MTQTSRPVTTVLMLALSLIAPAVGRAQDAAASRAVTVPTLVAATDFSYVSFSGATDPWRLASASLSRRSAAGSLIALDEVTFRRYNHRRDLWRLFFFALVEGLGYRQLTVVFRLHAFWKVMRGDTGWGVMQREGFAKGAK